jgi:hypothetical protein
MTRIGLAFRLFFRTLGNKSFAEQARALVERRALPAPPPVPPASVKALPARSDAVTLLAVLQREGRLVDFLKEDLSAYSDAQIGSAVRDVHRDCAAAIERLFALRPLRQEAEGASIDVPPGFDAARIRLTGNVAGQPPFKGTLRHTGWVATQAEIPEWSGSAEAASVVAPAEVELL